MAAIRWRPCPTRSLDRAGWISRQCTIPSGIGQGTTTSSGYRSSSRGHEARERPPMNADKRGWKTRIDKLSALIGVNWRLKTPLRLTPELRARIQASFDESSHDNEHFPSTID